MEMRNALTADRPPDDVEAAEIWTRAGPSIVGLVAMVVVLWFTQCTFAPIVAPTLLDSFVAYMAAEVAAMVALMGAFRVRSLRQRVSARLWIRSTQTVAVTMCAGIAASPWILLPFADEALRMLMIFLSLWFVAMVMMMDGSRLAMAGSLAVLVSMGAFVVAYAMPFALALVGFLAMAGITITVIRGLIWRAADRAAAARDLSERASKQLQAALDIVAAERDAKTRFIAAASHDLQQPIQAASLYFDQSQIGADAAARDRAAAGVRSALKSTQALLATMLDYLRLDAGATPVRRETVAVGAAIAEVAHEQGAAISAAGMRLIALPSSLSVTADAQLLKRALGNLVANAARHSTGKRVLIAARRGSSTIRLWVIDDGIGVPERDAARLFDDFTQGSGSASANGGGFGIGLASARRMAELMGGAIGLERRWRRGCAFWIDLSVAAITVSADKGAICEAA
jgi:signal transduction histidine kinase